MASVDDVRLSGQGRVARWSAGAWAEALLEAAIHQFIRVGRLEVRCPSGRRLAAGDASAQPVTVSIHDPAAVRRLALDPQLALGECYSDGVLAVENGDIADLLELVGRNLAARPPAGPEPARRALGLLAQLNGRAAARRNATHHYDLSVDFYRRFLDADLQYSCAYFERPDMTLEEAQAAKKRRIAAKLLLRPDARVLDIGCGWGGLGLSLARDYGARVEGVTLSPAQARFAQARAEREGLDGAVEFLERDYRDVAGAFDRIVSVGMLEHVGAPNYGDYFAAVSRLLGDDGVALVHAIGRVTPSGHVQPWIGKYIFPGGYIPALSEVIPAIEQAGLWITDIEVLRQHYALTLHHWRQRYLKHADEIAELHGAPFARTWDFYLALSEMAFRHRGCMVFQVQLAKRVDAVPITRNYMDSAPIRMLSAPSTQ